MTKRKTISSRKIFGDHKNSVTPNEAVSCNTLKRPLQVAFLSDCGGQRCCSIRFDLGARTIGPFSALRHRLIVVIGGDMRQYRAYEFDNRDSAQVYQYMEARIEALKRRIEQLEAEKKARSGNLDCAHIKSDAA
jgi:hypothetical protein